MAAEPAAAQRRGPGGERAGVYKAQLTPHWFEGGSKFWYQNELAGGKREFILVDAEQGKRGPAFNHEKLASALTEAGLQDLRADRLSLERSKSNCLTTLWNSCAGGKDWRCDLKTFKLTELKDRQPAVQGTSAPTPRATNSRISRTTGPETELTFVNRTSGEIEIFWLNTQGHAEPMERSAPGQRKSQHTFAGHVWEAVSGEGRSLGTFQAEEAATTIQIDGRASPPAEANRTALARRGLGGRCGGRGGSSRSPDGKWTASIKDHNVAIRVPTAIRRSN